MDWYLIRNEGKQSVLGTLNQDPLSSLPGWSIVAGPFQLIKQAEKEIEEGTTYEILIDMAMPVEQNC